MNSALKVIAILSLPLAFASKSFAAEDSSKASKSSVPVIDVYSKSQSKVDVVADQLEYNRDQKKIIAKNNAVIRYQNIRITADYAEVETESKQAFCRGHVVIFQNEQPRAHGDELTYNFESKTGSFPNGRTISLPWAATGKEVDQVRDGVKEVTRGVVTTCDREHPHYAVHAKKMTVYEKDKIVAKNVTIHILGKPVFWWPYLIIPLNQFQDQPFSVNVGRNSQWGTYIEVSKGIAITKNIGGKLHLDWRSRRGVGGGVDFNYNYGKYAQGTLQNYITQDKRAPTPGAENPFEQEEDRTRGRVTWKHRTDLDPYSNIQLRYNRLADEYFLQDFFPKEFRSDIEPTSFVTLTKNSPNYGFIANFEKQMNKFEKMTERLPEFKYNWKTQPFFSDKLFYENEYSFANLGNDYGRRMFDENVIRYGGQNEWSAPLQWNHIKATPFVNLGGTYYSRERFESDDHFRFTVAEGIDLRTHTYKTYPVSFEKLGIEINQLRHVLEPSIKYTHRTSTVSDERLTLFDNLDRLDDANVVTLGAENRLQTKRVVNGRMQRVDIVSLNTFLSYELYPDNQPNGPTILDIEDGQSSSDFTVLSQEIVLRPYQWLATETRFDYDMRKNNFRVFNQDVLFRMKKLRLLFGYRFVNDIGAFDGSGQFVFDVNYVINPLWAIGTYFRFNPEADNQNEWQISASRDLHDFILDFGYNVRDSSIRGGTNELFFSLTMKAFPKYNLRSGGSRASFADPRIGDTVAGANQSTAVSSAQETY